MDIALISRIFDPAHGGLERFQVNFAKILIREGHKVTLFVEKYSVSHADGMKVVAVKPSSVGFSPNTVRFAESVRKTIEKFSFDCVFSNTPFYPCDIHRAGGGINKHWYKVRMEEFGLLYRFYGCHPRYRAALKLEKEIYNPENVGFQIANSLLLKKQMIQYYGYPEKRIAPIYNGIDFSFFNYKWCLENRNRLRRQMNFSDKDVVILFPSNNAKRKGLSIISSAVSELKFNKSLTVLAVGRERIRSQNRMIRYEGHKDNILPYYAVSDCLVLPTIYEPCSNVVLEAMACGVVPITSPSNGASELIQHEKTGFVLNSWKDKEHLKDIFERIYYNIDMLKEMGVLANLSVQNLTLEKNACEILKLCRNVAQSKHISTPTRG